MSSETPLQHKSKRRSSKDVTAGYPSPATSPILKSKRSAHDLIFDMDEEDEENLPPLSSLTERLREAASPNPRPSPTSVPSPRESNPFSNRTAPSSGPLSSFQRASADAIPSPKDPARPWGATPLPSSKLNIKEVIEQASSSRTSTLSIGLSAKAITEPKTSGSFPGKLSQKERKRMMQAQLQGDSSPQLASEPAPASPSPASPWDLSAAKQRSASRTSSEPMLGSGSASAARTPHLTMRQTIANPSTSSKQNTPAIPVAPDAQSRGVSTPPIAPSPKSTQKAKQRQGSSSSKKATNAPGFAISDKPIPIQSVRHAPQRTKELTLDQRSILDILSEQAIEKTAIKDFAAKRSLQEIQQEQEFQEWWEKESARVIEEEQAAAAKGKRDTGGSRGRGKKRGRGGKAEGKKKEKGEASESQARKAKVKSEPAKAPAA